MAAIYNYSTSCASKVMNDSVLITMRSHKLEIIVYVFICNIYKGKQFQ